MATLSEMEKLLTNMQEAEQRLRAAISDANGTAKGLREQVRANKDFVTESIVTEVTKQVGELSDEARHEMVAAVSSVIDDLAARWRDRLGLADGASDA